MPILRRPSRMCGTAAAASSRSTVMRTISEPARASAATCAMVPSISAVSVLVIDCTTIGAPPPTATWPTMTWVVLCRALGPAISLWMGFSGLFMGVQISGFGVVQQRISEDGNSRIWAVNQKKPSNYKQGCGPEDRGERVMQDQIASHHAKQRGDEGKCRQFAGRIGLDQHKPEQKRQSDHPDRLIGHQRNGQRAGKTAHGPAGKEGCHAQNR